MDAFWTAAGPALAIFLLRITDVSIGTIRTIYSVRGHRVIATALGFVESLIWIYAISQLVATVRDNPWNMISWAIGFAVGTYTGITIEKWIASGSILVRVISPKHAIRMRAKLLDEGYGVTALPGIGRDGEVMVMFAVAARRRSDEILRHIQEIDPDAFITVEPISQAIGGYTPLLSSAPTSMRK
jgi:uncharacterized protein YebE (UPF0316 family)